MKTHFHCPPFSDNPLNVMQRIDGKMPPDGIEALRCRVEIPGGGTLVAYACGDHLFLMADNGGDNRLWFGRRTPLEVETPFVKAEATGPGRTKTMNMPNRDYNEVATHYRFEEDRHIRGDGRGYNDENEKWMTKVPYVWLPVKVTAENGDSMVHDFRFKMPAFGDATLVGAGPEISVKAEFHGIVREWKESLALIEKETEIEQRGGFWYARNNERDIRHYHFNNPLEVLLRHVGHSRLAEPAHAWWKAYLAAKDGPVAGNEDGLKATLKKAGIKENLERLEKELPTHRAFLRWLQDGKTVAKQKNNSLLAAFLEKVGRDWDALVAAIETAMTGKHEIESWHRDWDTDHGYIARQICLALPGADDRVAEQEAKADWTKRKGNAAQAEGVGIDAVAYPLLRAAVEAGEIPPGVFQQVNKHPVNVEFGIWEKALARGKEWADPIYAVAKNAARRTTYERDITSWLAFMFKIEKYLERHTGQTWNAVPRFVESQFDLEMSESDDENGTVKRRSALTPVADNATNIVTVPYVALAVSGARTQWCYSRHYHVFEEGFNDPISQGVVARDLEPKLNGRDDYGLCFYTLTGTDTARGYPTFLVIFERLSAKTRVHFHRVRPQRSKDGVPTPACRLVEACYQFMAGNVPASDVAAQQGDLIFIPHPNDPVAAGAKVENPEVGHGFVFESHEFTSPSPMAMYRSTAKTPNNRLGFLKADGPVHIGHPEHEHVDLPREGWWEIRRAKSWEANPKAIWSRTID